MLSTPTPAQRSPANISHTVLAETVAAPDGARTMVRSLAVSVREGGPKTVSSARSTVLPRIEVNGENAELVFDGKQRFEKLRLLGEGGLGEVVGAQDHDIGRKVAIKRLKPTVRSPAALARFVDEIRTIGKLEHPNIIPIHDVGVDEGGELYFVMKYVDGETLENVIEKLAEGDAQYHKHYTFERRVEIFRSILEALAFAHDRGIVHRDIKPANVMIGKFGEVLLMDWGIAKSLHSGALELPMVIAPDGTATFGNGAPAMSGNGAPAMSGNGAPAISGNGAPAISGNGAPAMSGNGAPAISGNGAPAASGKGAASRAFETQLGSLVGTPLYMSPEQASGLPTDERSDVYSACVLFAELLYLKHPHAAKTTLDDLLKAVRTESFPLYERGSAHQPFVPAELMWFLKFGLEKDPNKRYPSIRSMLDVLDRRANGEIQVHCAVTFTKSATMRSSRFVDAHPFVFIASAGLFALVFIALLAIAIHSAA